MMPHHRYSSCQVVITYIKVEQQCIRKLHLRMSRALRLAVCIQEVEKSIKEIDDYWQSYEQLGIIAVTCTIYQSAIQLSTLIVSVSKITHAGITALPLFIFFFSFIKVSNLRDHNKYIHTYIHHQNIIFIIIFLFIPH